VRPIIGVPLTRLTLRGLARGVSPRGPAFFVSAFETAAATGAAVERKDVRRLSCQAQTALAPVHGEHGTVHEAGLLGRRGDDRIGDLTRSLIAFDH
jgi:hypothetical protein